MSTPIISIVVISYNMVREIPRTIFTLRAPYQRNISNDDVEIIVVDNGSSVMPSLEPNWENVRLLSYPNPTPSPVAAINYGLSKAQGDLVGVMIDGARMASPNLLYYSLLSNKISDRAVISTMAYHLGSEVQMKSVLDGYTQDVEDELLKSVPWQSDGYKLFDICVFAGSSSLGWFSPIAETNALFMCKQLWKELNGYDVAFQTKGGGFSNLDTYYRASELSDTLLIRLLGEGTFHQVHGGIATNQHGDDNLQALFSEEYNRLRGHYFTSPTKPVLHVGQIGVPHKACLETSINNL